MGNRRDDDFNFDDDFFSDDRDTGGFDFDDDDLPPSLGDEIDRDMPELDEEREDRRSNPAFVILAALLVLIFLGGLGVIIFLAVQPQGPTEIELSATAAEQFNRTQIAFLQLTQTQSRDFELLTLTAAAASPTPSDTPTPSETPTPSDTPTLDPTLLTLAAVGISAQQTQTQQAILALTGTPTDVPGNEGGVDVQGTLDALAQQQAQIAGVLLSLTPAADGAEVQGTLVAQISTVQAEIQGQPDNALTATAFAQAIQDEAAIIAAQTVTPEVEDRLTAVAEAINRAETAQAALSANAELATQAAVGINQAATAQGLLALTAENLETQVAVIEAVRAAGTVQALFEDDGPPAVVQAPTGTPDPNATPDLTLTAQSDFLTASAPTAAVPTSPIDAVNQTATAIVAIFLTATAQGVDGAVVPGEVTPPPPTLEGGTPAATVPFGQLPDTGLFDDITGGGAGSLGLVALSVVGLVGVIVVSRRARSANTKREQDETTPSQQ